MSPKNRGTKKLSGKQNRTNCQNSSKATKGQRLDAMARKKDERAVRKEKKKESGSSDDKSFAEQLAVIGLKVRDVIGDGNCLFRALGDQLDGDDRAHMRHRQDVVRYITEHRADFEPFIEDDVPFDKHVQNLAIDGTYAGNDSIVAFARLHKLTVVIHQLDSPAWEVHGETATVTPAPTNHDNIKVHQLHISYHNGDHYASVRRLDDTSDAPANIRIERARPLTATPSSIDKNRNKPDGIDGGGSWMPSVVPNEVTNEENGISGTSDCGDASNSHFVDKVIEFTRCRDRQLVADLCEEASYFDIDFVCTTVLAFMDGVRSSSSSSAPSDGEANFEPGGGGGASAAKACGAVAPPKSSSTQQQHQSTAARRQRKQEKKARAALRRKLAITGATAFAPAPLRQMSSDEDDFVPSLIAQNLKVLQI